MRTRRLKEELSLAQGCKQWCRNSKLGYKARLAPGWQCLWQRQAGGSGLCIATTLWVQPKPHSLQALWPWASYLASLCLSFPLSKMRIIVKIQLAPTRKHWQTKDALRDAARPRRYQWRGTVSFENSKRRINPILLVAFLFFFISCFSIIAVCRQFWTMSVIKYSPPKKSVIGLNQRSTNLFCQEPERNYSQLCGPDGDPTAGSASARATADNSWMRECGCVPATLRCGCWNSNLLYFAHVVKYYSPFDFFPQPVKKNILSSYKNRHWAGFGQQALVCQLLV